MFKLCCFLFIVFISAKSKERQIQKSRLPIHQERGPNLSWRNPRCCKTSVTEVREMPVCPDLDICVWLSHTDSAGRAVINVLSCLYNSVYSLWLQIVSFDIRNYSASSRLHLRHYAYDRSIIIFVFDFIVNCIWTKIKIYKYLHRLLEISNTFLKSFFNWMKTGLRIVVMVLWKCMHLLNFKSFMGRPSLLLLFTVMS